QYAGQVLSDHLHSPTAILNINNGSILERYEYNAYGKATVWNSTFTTSTTTSTTTSSYGNPYLFTGRRLDTLDTGDFEVMYYRNRYYDTETGRFLQKDPAGYVDGMNLYEYVQSKPVFGLDPYGLDLDEEQKKYQKCWFRCEELARRNPSMVINDCRKKCKKVWKGQKMVVPTFGDIMGQIKKLTPCNGVGCIKPWTWELPPIPTPYGELKSSVGISGSVSKCKYKDKKKGTGLLLTIKLQANGQVCMGAGGKIPGYVDNSNKNFLPADCKVSSKCPTCEHKSGGKLQIFLYGRGGAYINGRIGLLATIIPFSEQKIEPVLSIGMGNYAGGQICLQVVGNVHRSYVMTK
ncbi:MAG: RHS repeat-associated core domain-containing protein, partial [Anaerohalosphaera sp.]|nr:RHS repeat-associated core domain-containing protein [Anaerohalosphaera sp.]